MIRIVDDAADAQARAGSKQDAGEAAVGILMLDSRFPRIPGDIGNASSWTFPVLYQVVNGASPDQVVRQGAEGLLRAFIDAARKLVGQGVDGIATTCGFLSLFQDDLAEAAGVPVAASPLMQVRLVNAILPRGKTAGILTISADSLTCEHMRKARIPRDTPIGTTEGLREFTRAILGNEPELDIEAARADNVDAAQTLAANHPEVGAFVLECTNMTPYAHDIQAATGLPVFTMASFIEWFQSGLAPRSYPFS